MRSRVVKSLMAFALIILIILTPFILSFLLSYILHSHHILFKYICIILFSFYTLIRYGKYKNKYTIYHIILCSILMLCVITISYFLFSENDINSFVYVMGLVSGHINLILAGASKNINIIDIDKIRITLSLLILIIYYIFFKVTPILVIVVILEMINAVLTYSNIYGEMFASDVHNSNINVTNLNFYQNIKRKNNKKITKKK